MRLVMLRTIPLAALLALAACSPSQSPTQHDAPTPRAQAEATANAPLGSAQWYAWVDRTLAIGDGEGHGPEHGSAEWNRAVQQRLGQEAPQQSPGTPAWQQAVDALLRTRTTAS